MKKLNGLADMLDVNVNKTLDDKVYAQYETGGEDWNSVIVYIEEDCGDLILTSNNNAVNEKIFGGKFFEADSIEDALEKIAEIDEMSYLDIENLEEYDFGGFEEEEDEIASGERFVFCGYGCRRTRPLGLSVA